MFEILALILLDLSKFVFVIFVLIHGLKKMNKVRTFMENKHATASVTYQFCKLKQHLHSSRLISKMSLCLSVLHFVWSCKMVCPNELNSAAVMMPSKKVDFPQALKIKISCYTALQANATPHI